MRGEANQKVPGEIATAKRAQLDTVLKQITRMRDRLVDRVALRLCVPAPAGTWGRGQVPGRTNDSAVPALRWAAEWSQRDHSHQQS